MQYKQSSKIVTRTLGDETLLIPINQTGASIQKIYSLNDTAKMVWEKIGSFKSTDQIIEEIISEFDIEDVGSVKNEVQSFLDELSGLHFIDMKD